MKMTRDYIQEKVATDPRWTKAAILALYECQTADEKNTASTVEHNRRGFNAFDAEFMSSLAEQLLAGRFLSAKQMSVARKKLGKYSGQLLRIAEEKAGR